MFTVSACFMGSFKLGDNINYNLDILAVLYTAQQRATDEDKASFNKPILLELVSIIEAILYDFYFKINGFTLEGVTNISTGMLDSIRGKKIDELGKYISNAKKHGFFGNRNETLYSDLDNLRKLRNRVHIQNNKKYSPRDEGEAFIDINVTLAEKSLEKVMKTMTQKHSRPNVKAHVKDFNCPWSEHFFEFIAP